MYVMGIDPTSTSATPLFFPGTLGAISPPVNLYTAPMGTTGSTAGSNPGDAVYMYVQFTTAVTVLNSVCIVDYLFAAGPMGVSIAAAGNMGKLVGVSQVLQTINFYGWIQVYGKCTLNVVAATGLNLQLFSGTTAGALYSTAAAAVRVDGVTIGAINGTKGTGVLQWPRVGGTTALA